MTFRQTIDAHSSMRISTTPNRAVLQFTCDCEGTEEGRRPECGSNRGEHTTCKRLSEGIATLRLTSPVPLSAPQSSDPRLPVVGLNTNVIVDGEALHVQTEDLAPKHAQLICHIFREGGCVLKVAKLDYSKHLDKPNLHSVLTRVMKVFHAKVIRSLYRRRLDTIPPCVALRESAPPPSALPAPSLPSPPPSQLRDSSAAAALAPERKARDTEPPEPVGHVWDRIVEDTHKHRSPLSVTKHRDETSPPSTTWERAVESARHGVRSAVTEVTPSAEPNLAPSAYEEGLASLRKGDAAGALVSLARAVQLSPQNPRYRAALRRALEALDDSDRSPR